MTAVDDGGRDGAERERKTEGGPTQGRWQWKESRRWVLQDWRRWSVRRWSGEGEEGQKRGEEGQKKGGEGWPRPWPHPVRRTWPVSPEMATEKKNESDIQISETCIYMYIRTCRHNKPLRLLCRRN